MPSVLRDLDYLHPLLRDEVKRIQREVIDRHKAPFRVFETARTTERQMDLIAKRKQRTLVTRYLMDMDSDPVIYSTAVNYVYYTSRWSWDLRDMTVKRWYQLFGELVLDLCPNLEWAGYWRSNIDYTNFQLKQAVCDAEGIIIPRGSVIRDGGKKHEEGSRTTVRGNGQLDSTGSDQDRVHPTG